MDDSRAATTLASAQRGKAARKEARQQKDAASKVAAIQRGRQQRTTARKENAAAVVLQSRERGRKGRKREAWRGDGGAGQRYFTPAEVSRHDRADDLWVSLFHRVLDLTELVEANPGSLVQPLIDAAGTDITHWFDPITKDVRTHIDPETDLEVAFTPMGRFLHVAPPTASSAWATDFGARPAPRPPHGPSPVPPAPVLTPPPPPRAGTPWWKDAALGVGRLTEKPRTIKLLNLLTRQEDTLEVCAEETLGEIQQRYLEYNEHAPSYVWKRTDAAAVARVLDMKKTLDENGIPDETAAFDDLDIPDGYYVPTIHLYFSDDLTVA